MPENAAESRRCFERHVDQRGSGGGDVPESEPVCCFAEVGYDVLGCDGEGHVGAIEGVCWDRFGFWWKLVLRLWIRVARFFKFGDVDAGESAGQNFTGSRSSCDR